MDIKLNPGQAVAITGPQGSGKTKLACDLAKGFGKYSVLYASDLFSPFAAIRCLEERPDALVVESTSREQLESAHVKALITNAEISIKAKGREQVVFRTPRFIFVMRDEERLTLRNESRRIRVVRLGGKTVGSAQPPQGTPSTASPQGLRFLTCGCQWQAIDAELHALSKLYSEKARQARATAKRHRSRGALVAWRRSNAVARVWELADKALLKLGCPF